MNTPLVVFPPTRTDTWDRCQLLDALQNQEHWMPKQATRQLVGSLCGRAFAIGTAILHKGGPIKDAVDQAVSSLHADIQHHINYGVTFEVSRDELVAASEIDRVLPLYAKEDCFRDWKIQHIEHRLEDYGRCIIDLGGRDSDGLLAVADVKYKRNLEARYEQSTIDEYLYSWQFLHYPWAYGEYMKEPCYRMYLCLVVAKPRFHVRLIPHEIHPETQQIWKVSAVAKWARMAQPEAVPEMASRHKDMYGPCPYYRACFEFHLDEGLMASEYTQVPRREEPCSGT